MRSAGKKAIRVPGLSFPGSGGQVAVQVVPLLFLAGLLWWTLLEYLLHRFVLHGLPRSLGSRHMQHHDRPRERRLALAPLASSLGGATLHGVAFFGLFGPAAGAPLLAGVVVGYLAYEWVHWSSHYRPSRSRIARGLRRHHQLHHHAMPDRRFGVTSPLWDWVFATLSSPREGRAAAVRGGRAHLSR